MNAVDTNVLIYSCDSRDHAKRDRARQVLAESSGGVLLWQVACEFVHASRQLAVQGFGQATAWQQLDDLLRVFTLATPAPAALMRAKDLQLNAQVSFWDAMVIASALEAGVTRLYSEDLPGHLVKGIEIINPFAGSSPRNQDS